MFNHDNYGSNVLVTTMTPEQVQSHLQTPSKGGTLVASVTSFATVSQLCLPLDSSLEFQIGTSNCLQLVLE